MNETQRQHFASLYPTPERVLDLVRNLCSPEEVFRIEQLAEWARSFGLVPRAEADVSTRSADPGSTREAEGEIRVLDCCGDAGFSIPWAHWKARRVPIVPTRNTRRPFVYLFGPASVPASNFRDDFPSCVRTLGIGGYTNADGSVEWESVAEQLSQPGLVREFMSATPPGSGPRPKPTSGPIPSTSTGPLPDGVAGCLGADGRNVRLVGSSPVAELCFDVGRAEPHVRQLLESFGVGRFGFLALNLAACDALRELLERARDTIPSAVEGQDAHDLADPCRQLLALLAECRRVLVEEREKRRRNDPSAAFAEMIRSILGSGGKN